MNRLPWRPIALGAVMRPARPSLGQVSPSVLSVEVVDISGKPIPGATVEVLGQQTAQTDGHGKAIFNVPAGPHNIRATYDDMVVVKSISSDELRQGATAFIEFPACIMGPLLRPIDLAIFAAAGGMIWAGSHFKVKALEMTGEVALGAAVFGFIYRLQCM